MHNLFGSEHNLSHFGGSFEVRGSQNRLGLSSEILLELILHLKDGERRLKVLPKQKGD